MSIHVLHVIKVVLVAGAERHLLALLPGLQKHDIRSTLLMLVEPGKPMDDYVDMLEAAGVSVVREVIRNDIDPTLFSRLRKDIQQIQPDIVHTHLLHADLYATLAASAQGVPVITTRHNDNTFRHRWWMRLIHRFLWSRVARGIAISKAVKTFCLGVEGAHPEQIQIIYYGINPETDAHDVPSARSALRKQLGLPDNALIVGTMSRLIEQKGLVYGIRAFVKLMNDHPSAHLVIAGDGVLRGQLEELVADLGAEGRVHFLGWVAEPTAVLAGYDILLMPSLWEGFGLVMLEAMAQGVPIVGTQTSAIPEVIVDKKTGLLVPPKNVNMLEIELYGLLLREEERQQMGRSAKERLETHFSVAYMCAETANLYQQVKP